MSFRMRMVCLFVASGVAAAGIAAGQAPAGANAAFEKYVAGVEQWVLQTADSPVSEARPGAPGDPKGLVTADVWSRVKAGEVVIERLTPKNGDVPGGMLHHWSGTAFAPGARAADFQRVMRDVERFPEIYAPQVERAKVLSVEGDHRWITMRVKQTHILTVVLETDYDVTSGAGWSASRSTAVREIADAGTGKEHALGPGQEHGFLWRLNTYWTYEERDGGLLMRIESVSLTRGIPAGLGWAIRPFIESVPRESLEFTLRKTVEAVEGRRG